MTRAEHLLECVQEECAEVSKVLSKAKRFGLQNCYPDTGPTNRAKIRQELVDLLGAYQRCVDEGLLLALGLPQLPFPVVQAMQVKAEKIEANIHKAKELGTLTVSEVVE